MSHDDRDTKQYWDELLKPYAKTNNRSALFQLLTTGGLFALNWVLMLLSLGWSYWITLALSVPAAFLMVRLFIFQHDCGHGAFFSSQKWSDVVGRVIGVMTLTPYHYWRRAHAYHHAHVGDLQFRDLGEVKTLTVREFKALTRRQRLGYWLYRHPLTLLVFGPVWQFVIRHRWPHVLPGWKKERWSAVYTDLALIAVVAAAWMTIGIESFLLVQVPITVISGVVGVWLFYVQHQFEDTYWREHPDWNFHRAGIEGSSFYDLPPILHWLTGNIGFHHAHHLMSRIPNYNLARCFREVSALHGVTRLTLWKSFECLFFQLWDEETKHLISFRRARQLYGK